MTSWSHTWVLHANTTIAAHHPASGRRTITRRIESVTGRSSARSHGLVDLLKELSDLVDVGASALPVGLEAAQRRLRPGPRLAQPAAPRQGGGDVGAGLRRTVGVSAPLLVADGLLGVVQGALKQTRVVVDEAELIVDHGQIGDRARGDKLECLLVAADGGLQVSPQHLLGRAPSPACLEALVGDVPELTVACGAARPVLLIEQAKAALVVALRPVQVPQGRHR